MKREQRSASLFWLCILACLLFCLWELSVMLPPQLRTIDIPPDTLIITVPSSPSLTQQRIGILANGNLLNMLYAATITLPPYQPRSMCLSNLSSPYLLRFLKQGKTIVSALYQTSGCTTITVNGNKRRTPTEAFSRLLNQAINDTNLFER